MTYPEIVTEAMNAANVATDNDMRQRVFDMLMRHMLSLHRAELLRAAATLKKFGEKQ